MGLKHEGGESILMRVYKATVVEPLDRLRKYGLRITPNEEFDQDLEDALKKTADLVRKNQAVPGTESAPNAKGGLNQS